MRCPRCGYPNIQYYTVEQEEPTSAGMIICYIFLALTGVGIIVLLLMMIADKKRVVKTYGFCPRCLLRFDTSRYRLVQTSTPQQQSDTTISKKSSDILGIIGTVCGSISVLFAMPLLFLEHPGVLYCLAILLSLGGIILSSIALFLGKKISVIAIIGLSLSILAIIILMIDLFVEMMSIV